MFLDVYSIALQFPVVNNFRKLFSTKEEIMNLGERIKLLAENNGVKNADIARVAGVSRSAVTKWFNGTSQPKADVIPKLAVFFNMPIEYFLEDDEIVAYAAGNPYEVAAGNGRFNDDNGTGEYSEVRICGDSMFPALHDGDIVMVHHVTENISPKDFAIVKINGEESTCKHIEITKDGLWLKAENKEVFADKFYTIHDVLTLPVTIIGVATEIVSRKL